MKILFVFSFADAQSSKKPFQNQEQIHFGISYISSLLKKHGHTTKLAVLCKFFAKDNNRVIEECIHNFSPELICFTTVSTEYDFINEMARYIKTRYPDIYLAVGGCHVSLNPEKVFPGWFDALCIGEGEFPVLELVTQLEAGVTPAKIRNLWIKHGGGN